MLIYLRRCKSCHVALMKFNLNSTYNEVGHIKGDFFKVCNYMHRRHTIQISRWLVRLLYQWQTKTCVSNFTTFEILLYKIWIQLDLNNQFSARRTRPLLHSQFRPSVRLSVTLVIHTTSARDIETGFSTMPQCLRILRAKFRCHTFRGSPPNKMC